MELYPLNRNSSVVPQSTLVFLIDRISGPRGQLGNERIDSLSAPRLVPERHHLRSAIAPYLPENLALFVGVGIMSVRVQSLWKALYLHLLDASTLYTLSPGSRQLGSVPCELPNESAATGFVCGVRR